MASRQTSVNKEDNLNDSWVELNYQQNASRPTSQSSTPPHMWGGPVALHGATMEKLLLEAQREWSRSSSRIGSNAGSSRGSPKSPPNSPNTEPNILELSQGVVLPPGLNLREISTIEEAEVPKPANSQENADWIWDWSSRPEAQPHNDSSKYRHPQRPKLSVRNTGLMRYWPLTWDNLPAMILTHAATFFLGAAAMFLCLKKYSNWSPMTTMATD